MPHVLFRRKVLDAKLNNWLAGISLAQPLRLWMLIATAVAATFVSLEIYIPIPSINGQSVTTSELTAVLGHYTSAKTSWMYCRVPTNSSTEHLPWQRFRAMRLVSNTQSDLEQKRMMGLASAQNTTVQTPSRMM